MTRPLTTAEAFEELGRALRAAGEAVRRAILGPLLAAPPSIYSRTLPYSAELLFDMPWDIWPLWLRKEWYRLGHGLGRRSDDLRGKLP